MFQMLLAVEIEVQWLPFLGSKRGLRLEFLCSEANGLGISGRRTGRIMRNMKNFPRVAGITGTTLVGVFFFFAIIGVFGLQSAIAALVVFVLVAVITCCVFSGERLDL